MADLLGKLKAKGRVARNLAAAYWQVLNFPTVKNPRRHSLPGKLVMSLTSYPLRFGTLPLTLRSILDQEVRPDEVQLWISWEDKDAITDRIRALEAHGLTIHFCENAKSYNKIIPSLAQDGSNYIITVDDDCYYPRDLVKVLTEEFDPNAPAIICRRAHAITRTADGAIRPYLEWQGNINENTPASAPRGDLLGTGHGGVLYFPGCFDPEVLNAATFKAICPNADDVWLYWMARRAGTRYRKVGGKFVSTNWRGTQEESLMSTNVSQSGNDVQIQRMIERFGMVDLD